MQISRGGLEGQSPSSPATRAARRNTSAETQGVLEYTFNDTSGVYSIEVFTYDETDGEATITVEVNGVEVGAYTLDQNPGGAVPSFGNRTSFTISDLSLNTGDVVRIIGNNNVEEWSRIDEIVIDGGPVAPTPAPTPAPSNDIIVEAEDIIDTGYVVQTSPVASEGEYASLFNLDENNSSETGTLEHVFTGASGAYDIDLNVFDESDGQAEIIVSVNGAAVGSVTLDGDTGVTGVSGDNLVSYTLPGVQLETGDTITLASARNLNEWARIDNIVYRETTLAPTPAPTPTDSGTIRLEAEDIISSGYGVQNSTAASGSAYASLFNGVVANSPDTGELEHTFNGSDGVYALEVHAFDEDDGEATVTVLVNGEEVGTQTLNQDLGEPGVAATNLVGLTFPDLALQNGDTVTIRGNRDGAEWARIDEIVYTKTANIFSVQAEDMQTDGFVTETWNGIAAENEVRSLYLGSNSVGTLSHTFTGSDATYTLQVMAFDENDGQGQIDVYLNGELLSSFDLSQDLGVPGVAVENRVALEITDVVVRQGDVLEMRGVRNQQEFVRIDEVVFTETGAAPALPLPTAPNVITVQAEDMIPDGFVDETWTGIAVNDQVATLYRGSNTEGSLTYTFDGPTATYNLAVDTFDENDGTGQVELLVNGVQVASTVLNADLGEPGVDAANSVSLDAAGVVLRAGDEIEIRAVRDAQEFIRIDQISFTEAGPAPTPTETITVEAESLTASGYVSESWAGIASGDAVASLYTGDDQGSLSYTFAGDPGEYTLSVNTFEENDGASTIEVLINGQSVNTTVLDGDFGRAGVETLNAFAIDVSALQLRSGDVIEIRGTRDNGEYARIDSLTFTPTGPEVSAVQAQAVALKTADGFLLSASSEKQIVAATETASTPDATASQNTVSEVLTPEIDMSPMSTPDDDFLA